MAIHDLDIREEEQDRLRNYFDDTRIHFGRNRRTGKLEAWYKPTSGLPYRICEAVNVCHALKQMEERSRIDREGAVNALRRIDAHNEHLAEYAKQDAMTEVRSQLRDAVKNRFIFSMG